MMMCGKLEVVLMVLCKHAGGNESIRSVTDTVCGVFADHLTACNLDCCLSVYMTR
jgi:hypothetical protein